MRISDSYIEQNRLLHATRDDYGRSGKFWAKYIERLVSEEGYASLLDYGCGKGTLAEALPELKIAEYDPAIAGKDAEPPPAELVVCTDVLEHIEPDLLDAVLQHLCRLTLKKLFFNVATRPAVKTLPDGRNAHLIIQPAPWWAERLSRYFQITNYQVRDGMVYGEAFPAHTAVKSIPHKHRTRKERRNIDRQLQPFYETIRHCTRRYGDALSTIDTIRQWEPGDTHRAHMLVVVHILENLNAAVVGGPMAYAGATSQLDAVLKDICYYADRAVCAIVRLDQTRGVAYWRAVLEKYIRISDANEAPPGQLCVIGAPSVNVAGVTSKGAVADDTRWEQIKINVARFPKRIQKVPAHDRRIILACYGPSLAESIGPMAAEFSTPGARADIASVSGAHDFLLDKGVTPTFHVECDPRPHKADNIECGREGVRYLIGSVVHSCLMDKLEGHDVALWHVSTADSVVRIIDELKEASSALVSGGGSVGLRAIPLFYALGYRLFSIYAMDCSFANGGEQQWAGKHAGKRQQVTTAECEDRLFVTSPNLLTYATNFIETIQKMPDCTFRVYGDGLLPAMCRVYSKLPNIKAA